MKRLLIPLLLVFALNSASYAAEPVKPKATDKCPVCGMFVAKYPDFVAEIIYKDGYYAVFDGAKDMFKYHQNLAKYDPSRKLEDIESIYVTDYYTLRLIDAMTAIFIIGSDVTGPMGAELIPFEKKEDADEFMQDHTGKTQVSFRDVTPEVLKPLK